MHVHSILIKRLHCFVKMFVPHGDQDITASCECSYKYKEIFKERAKCIIVKGAEHRFKSFAFREARMKAALDFLKDELL